MRMTLYQSFVSDVYCVAVVVARPGVVVTVQVQHIVLAKGKGGKGDQSESEHIEKSNQGASHARWMSD